MNRGKKIYFGLLLLGVFLVSTMYFSYAFFTSINEEHGKLNIVAGTLDYKISGAEIENNQVTVSANSRKEITLEITSLNDINSKYELYYVVNNGVNVDVGYNSDTVDLVSGEIDANSTKTITLSIRNNTSSSQIVTFGVQGGLITDQLVLTKGNSISEFGVYAENILNGATPVLTNNLVPVKIADDGTLTKANLYDEWYSYEDKIWANAVVLDSHYSEDSIYDLSGNGNNATIYGATMTEEGLSFDGVDDYAKIDLLEWNSSNEFTLEFKAKIDSNDGASILFESSSNSNRNNGSFYIDTNEYGTNDITLAMKAKETYENGTQSSTYNNHKYADNILDKDEYKTYTITFNSKNTYNDFINIYVDGIKQKVAVPTLHVGIDYDISGLALEDYAFFIGSRNGEENFTQMIIKSLKIYTKELSQEEVDNSLNGTLVTDDLILMYKFNDYINNEVISEEAIESYFVWIPKYSYQLWDLGDYSNLTAIDLSKPHAIPIKFGLTNTSDSVVGECATPGVAGESGSCKVGDYMTHPAFLAFDTNGLWVGKFETGYDGSTTTAEAQINSSDSSKVVIKPNVYSWRNLTVGNMFKTSYNYLRSDESHMMKNTEWGAVAYLQHSVYGSQGSLRINNNSAYITGYAGVEEPILGYNSGISIEGNRLESTALSTDGTYTVNYLNNASTNASTTGNYTGIYDMSGGAWDYVMGYTTGATTVGGSSEITSLYSTFFTDSSWEKYYDKYSSTTNTTYNNRILGDATGEMGSFGSQVDPDSTTRYKSSWFLDYANFINSSSSWFQRGGYWVHGITTGSFAFADRTGGKSSQVSFRVVLAP